MFELLWSICAKADGGHAWCGGREDVARDDAGGKAFGIHGLYGLYAHEGGYGQGVSEDLFYVLSKGWRRCRQTAVDLYV